jgi:hypothetical protein
MSRDDARELYRAMLDGRVSELELGGILLALRIKGESVDEMAGFLDAAEACSPLQAPPASCAGGDPYLQRRAQDGQPDPAAGAAAGARRRAGAGAWRGARCGRVARPKCSKRWACCRRPTVARRNRPVAGKVA